MKTRPRLPEPRLGLHADLDPGIQLNALPGRALSLLRPLTVGPHARIRFGTVLYASTRIGKHFETGHHVVVREENQIGHHVSIWNNTTIDYGCFIGSRVKIHCNCYVAQYTILEEDVFLAPGVILANDPFPGSKHSARTLQGPIIGRGAQIGVNCTILPGIKIGARALIGAGSVVTQDVPADTVVWGNPARVRKDRKDLKWPLDYVISRPKEDRFYRRQVAGRPVFD
jgi:acetyltransferase-like isoleucine patch superfamily enzyme